MRAKHGALLSAPSMPAKCVGSVKFSVVVQDSHSPSSLFVVHDTDKPRKPSKRRRTTRRTRSLGVAPVSVEASAVRRVDLPPSLHPTCVLVMRSNDADVAVFGTRQGSIHAVTFNEDWTAIQGCQTFIVDSGEGLGLRRNT